MLWQEWPPWSTCCVCTKPHTCWGLIYLHCLECSYRSSREVLSPIYRWGSSIFFPCLLPCCLTAQYVECHAKDLVWNLTGEGLILTLLYTCGVLRTFLNLLEPQFLICTTELVISASALSFSVSTLRKALRNRPKESCSHLHSHWISSCFNFVIVFITIWKDFMCHWVTWLLSAYPLDCKFREGMNS